MDKPCCYDCKTVEALRPYGPGGQWVCFDCAFKTPDRAQQTENSIGALFQAAGALSPSGIIVIGSQEGPQPIEAVDLG